MCKALSRVQDTSLRDWRRETLLSWVDWRDSINKDDMDYVTKVVISRQVSSGDDNSNSMENQ